MDMVDQEYLRKGAPLCDGWSVLSDGDQIKPDETLAAYWIERLPRVYIAGMAMQLMEQVNKTTKWCVHIYKDRTIISAGASYKPTTHISNDPAWNTIRAVIDADVLPQGDKNGR